MSLKLARNKIHAKTGRPKSSLDQQNRDPQTKAYNNTIKKCPLIKTNNPLTPNLADIHHKLIEQVMAPYGQGKKNKRTKFMHNRAWNHIIINLSNIHKQKASHYFN